MDVEDAFKAIYRQDFLPEEFKGHADHDKPFPIGYGQTNSQPSTVRAMLEWLEIEEGQKVLDVGSGSGWTTALLSRLVGGSGTVYAVELVPELVEMGRQNCENVDIKNAKFHEAGKILGLPEYAPFDRILVSASASRIHNELLEQLAKPGRMVIPVGNTIYEIEKDDSGRLDKVLHDGYVFVPLIT